MAAGHLLAMLVVLLPFASLGALVQWRQQIPLGASVLVIGFGLVRHDAGLMPVPIHLGSGPTLVLSRYGQH